MYALDLLGRYWWLFLPVLVLLPFMVEYFIDRNNWLKKGSEILTTMIAVFVAVVFAIIQTKYERAAERFSDAFSLVEGSEKEAGIVLNRLFSILKPDVYVYSLKSDDEDILIRSDIDETLIEILLMKSGEEIMYFLKNTLEIPNKVVANPVVLSGLSSIITNALLQARSNIELKQKGLSSARSRFNNKPNSLKEFDENQIFRIIEAIDHLRMISCVAKQCLETDIRKTKQRICDTLEDEVVNFYDIVEFAEKRAGCKRRFYWDYAR